MRLAAAASGLCLVAAGCGGGGGGGGGGGASETTTGDSVSVTDPEVQQEFHPEFLESLWLTFANGVPPRFTLDPESKRLVDVTRGSVEFQSQRQLAEFAREQGLLGFGTADFTASGGFEYWGIVTWVFRHRDGARATFERFPDPEQATIDDATKTATRSEAYGGNYLGNLTAETYVADDGVTTLFLRGSMVDDKALHYVSAVVDLQGGASLDGLSEIRRVMKPLEGLYPAIFREFLRLGGTDDAPTTTTSDPSFVPGSPEP